MCTDKRFSRFSIWLIWLWLAILSPIATAQLLENNKLLPANEAFRPQVVHTPNGVMVEFAIADGYYLYQDKISIHTTPEQMLDNPKFSPTVLKNDLNFGKQQVYYHTAKIDLPFKNKAPIADIFSIEVHHQGCYEKGVCYPPVISHFQINGHGVFMAQDGNGTKTPEVTFTRDDTEHLLEHNTTTITQNSVWLNLFTFFMAGLALSFTACMYPLLPILSSIIVGNNHAQLNKKQGFILSFAYVQGLALTYTVIGVITALTGALLTIWLQQPVVIIAAALLMVVLALGMFDLIHIQMPSKIQQYFTQKNQSLCGGKISSVFVMGMFSALIVGPCVAPPLAIALGYIGQTKDALLGGGLLYIMALGMGIPLMLIGTFGGHILPKSGRWMNTIKYFFGFIILGLAIYLVTPFVHLWLVIASYCLLALLIMVLLAKEIRLTQPLFNRLFFGLCFFCLLAGSAYFLLNSLKQTNTPLHQSLSIYFAQSSDSKKISSVTELKQSIAEAQKQSPEKPVILDFYADWCITCKKMDATTFADPQVQKILASDYQFIQIDVTKNTVEHQALLKQYGLFGPPARFVLYQDQSYSLPLLGFAKEEDFLLWLNNNREKR